MRWLLIIFIFLIMGCQQDTTISCNSSEIIIAGECCLDSNNNSICDYIELNDYKFINIIKEQSDNESLKKYINLTEFQYGVNKTFYPLYSLSFNLTNRTNITGFKATYDKYLSDEWYMVILKIKDTFNYHYTEEDFSNFIYKKYNLTVRDWKIDAAKFIDEKRLTDRNWEKADYDYKHSLEEIVISGKKSFYEIHSLMFGISGQLWRPGLHVKIYVSCTPELIIQVYGPATWRVPYFRESLVSTQQERFNQTILRGYKNNTIAAERVLKLCEGGFDPIDWKSTETVFRGRDGFRPNKIHMKINETLIIHNHNDEGYGLALTLERKIPNRIIFNSKQIAYGDWGHVSFEKPGNYTIFQEQFNPRAKVIVIE